MLLVAQHQELLNVLRMKLMFMFLLLQEEMEVLWDSLGLDRFAKHAERIVPTSIDMEFRENKKIKYNTQPR